MSRPRRGVALLAALWLVVLITLAGAGLAGAASERRALGLGAVDRVREGAALEGALAQLHARLEAQLQARRDEGGRSRRVAVAAGRRAAALADPWAMLTGSDGLALLVGDVPVAVRLLDLGTVRNVNTLGEAELATLAGSVLGDAETGRSLAQAIADWRDPDDLARPRGAERAAYERDGRTALPTNAPFRELDDLRHVRGMTPERLARLRPYLTTLGASGRVNLNAAPEPVLRTLPGLTPAERAQLLALRAAGRRVESVPALVTAAAGAGPGGGGASRALQLASATTVDVRELLVELRVARPGVPSSASLRAVLLRTDDGRVLTGDRRW